MKKLKVSFPLMGNYHIPISYFLKHVMDADIMLPPPITVSTLELGTKYSPDFVCIPFKYTLGTFIEELNLGANVLIQAGGGCRYGYYSELQEKILKDLGYDFIYINLVSKGVTDYKKIISEFRKIDKNVKVYKMIYYALITRNMIKYMDRIEVSSFNSLFGAINSICFTKKSLKSFDDISGSCSNLRRIIFIRPSRSNPRGYSFVPIATCVAPSEQKIILSYFSR